MKRQKLQDLFLQSALSLQETVHEFKHCLTNSYANIRKNLNQVFTPLVRRIKKNNTRVFWVSKKWVKLGDSTKLHSNGGATDGCTYFNWGTNTGADHLVLKPKTDRYVVPEEGKFLIFPSWLNHSDAPFYGKGERRTLSANFRVPFSSSAKDESSGDLHFKNMFERDKEPEVTADTPIDDIL